MCSFLVKVFMFALLVGNAAVSERTKDLMYENLNGNYACFRRLNGTHQIGCSSSNGGTTGVVHYVEQMPDIYFILENGTSPPYIPVIPESLLDRELIDLLRNNSHLVSGLIIYKSNERITRYSHEEVCPNSESNVRGTCDRKWNLAGTGLLREDVPFPIFYVDDGDDLNAIRECFGKFNNFSYGEQNARPLCSLELKSFMFATIDTPTCIRRSNVLVNFNPAKFCDPLGDENVWASLQPLTNSSGGIEMKRKRHVMIVARLDATAFFHHKVPGAVNPITSLVALLSTAHYLKKMVNETNVNENVLFVLFNGESYDYIGSQRFVYDMENGFFPGKSDPESNASPITLDDIRLIVELNQLSPTKKLQVFVPDARTDVDLFIDNLNASTRERFEIVVNRGVLPPASLQSFLRRNATVPMLAITDHGSTYANRFYNSLLDDGDRLNYTYYPPNQSERIPIDSLQYHLANVSDVLARAIYNEFSGTPYDGTLKADVIMVNELLNCYLENANCTVHHAVQRKNFMEEPLQLYVSVTVSANYFTHLVGLTLAWLTGDVIADKPCGYDLKSHTYKYFNMSKDLSHLNETFCYRTIMNFTDAISPAFIIKDYDWQSGVYSTWSESSWSEFGLRLFLKPSIAHENVTIAVGSLVFVFSFVVVYFVKSRSHILFAPIVEMPPTRC